MTTKKVTSLSINGREFRVKEGTEPVDLTPFTYRSERPPCKEQFAVIVKGASQGWSGGPYLPNHAEYIFDTEEEAKRFIEERNGNPNN